MNAEGAKIWQRMTRDNIGRCIAVVLDDYVRSYPRVQNEIAGGNTEITGDFTLEEAEDLANILKSGKMPAPARIIQDTVESITSAGVSPFVGGFMKGWRPQLPTFGIAADFQRTRTPTRFNQLAV